MTRKILVVDDSDDFRDILVALLEFEGYAVVSAVDGEKALSLLRDYEPDLILSDVQMPQCDGFQLIRRIAELALSPVPIVLMSGYLGDASIDFSQYPNLVDIISKPVKFDALLAKLRGPEWLAPSTFAAGPSYTLNRNSITSPSATT